MASCYGSILPAVVCKKNLRRGSLLSSSHSSHPKFGKKKAKLKVFQRNKYLSRKKKDMKLMFVEIAIGDL